MLVALFVDCAGGALFGFLLRDATVLVRILDVVVLAVALAALFDSSWHFDPLLSWAQN